MQLKFIDKKARFVCEVFGIEEKKFSMLRDAMSQHFKKTQEGDNMEAPSKTEMLKEFLDSKEFKDANYPLKTPNDYFILGYVFMTVLERIKPEGAKFMEMLHGMLPPHGHGEDEEEGSEKLPN